MKKQILVCLAFMAGPVFVFAQRKTVQEQLGYPADTKLLIIHADDLGVSHSENMASIKAFEKGIVNSGSMMVPCPWFSEIADYFRKNPRSDLGLHLTLTSEWNNFKWGPVSSSSIVPGLVNSNGFLYSSVDSVQMNATGAEVEAEMRAQVEKALHFGLDITHLDAHMGTAFSKREYFLSFLKLSRDYNIPAFLPAPLFAGFNLKPDSLLTNRDIVTDNILTASPEDFKQGMSAFYRRALHDLKPGLTYLIIHLAYDNDEMRAVTIDHPDWGAGWRQADFDFFTSEECKKILEDEKIKLVTWRELRDKVVRRSN